MWYSTLVVRTQSVAQCLHHDLSYVQYHEVHRPVRLNSQYILRTFHCCLNDYTSGIMYADDMQAYIEVPVADVDQARTVLQDCINHVSGWCMSSLLLLNAGKLRTDLVRFQSQSCQAVSANELDLQPSVDTIHPATSVRDLGVLLGSERTRSKHASKVTSICFFQLCRLWQIRHLVGREVTAHLVSVLVLSWLDCCNSVLGSLLSHFSLKPFDSVTPTLKQLIRLPIEHPIKYKLCLLVRLVHINRVPQYLTSILTTVAESITGPGFQSADTAAYAIHHTRTRFGEYGFCFAGPVACNSLASHLHSITDAIVFKRKLKTELFRQAFDHWRAFYQRSWLILYSCILEILYVFCICVDFH